MKKLLSLVTSVLVIGLFLAGCGSETETEQEPENSNQGLLKIYTTVYPLQFFTEEIGKDLVDVSTIYPPGSDEHTFEPSQKDMMQLADSDLFIYVGLGLEGFVNNAEKTLKDEDVILFPAGEGIHLDPHEEDADGHDDHGHNHDVDPHVWIDPVYAKELAEGIKNELIKQLPDHEQQLEENYAALSDQLDRLHEQFETTIKEANKKQIIVSHAAYGYWEERYGLEQISVSGLSSSSEPTQKQLENIISTAKEHDLKYIFFEQNVSSRLTETVQKEMNAESLVLHNLSVLTDKDISENRNYFTIMEDNLNAIKTALY
ncbi:metal ABC transporter solute-binding protein, Zn/Mn family [Bacillus dakarensis]|uniref:metal ABC transporter solute-binding protein, Zn/Mn family n=1 Tax=Robertmurraya dakarensis TaxID=1926278 RepID=UPI000981BCFE|nr:zinc ABC transporter substrate-binding protein [Bacillus dakarensis]